MENPKDNHISKSFSPLEEQKGTCPFRLSKWYHDVKGEESTSESCQTKHHK